MARNKLTQKDVANSKTDKAEIFLADGDNLYLRIRRSSTGTISKTWIFWYTSPVLDKQNGTTTRRKQSLGHYPTLSLEEARLKADTSRKFIAEGIDPIKYREQAVLARRLDNAPQTVEELFLQWKKDWLEPNHTDKGNYVQGMLTRHALPDLGKVELANLRAPMIAGILTKLKVTGKARTSSVVLSSFRQMCCYAVECGWLPGDPTAAMRKKTWAGSSTKPRERVLSEAEICELSVKVPKAELAVEHEYAIWLMLSCLTRVGETSLAQIKHLDFNAATWLIPKENQKKVIGGNTDHLINLSPFALALLKRLAACRGVLKNHQPQPKDYLFPAKTRPGAMNEKTIAHALDDRQRFGRARTKGRTQLTTALELPGGKWTAHDLRRTGATLMRELGVASDVVDRCQNHREQDKIRATYQRSELREEMRQGWATLGKYLEGLVK